MSQALPQIDQAASDFRATFIVSLFRYTHDVLRRGPPQTVAVVLFHVSCLVARDRVIVLVSGVSERFVKVGATGLIDVDKLLHLLEAHELLFQSRASLRSLGPQERLDESLFV